MFLVTKYDFQDSGGIRIYGGLANFQDPGEDGLCRTMTFSRGSSDPRWHYDLFYNFPYKNIHKLYCRQVERKRAINTQRQRKRETHTRTHTHTHNVIEDERNVLFNCDLYAGLSTKLIARLNSAPEISSNIDNQNNYLPLTINERSLQLKIMKLLSHNTVSNPNNTYIDQYN